MTKAFAINGKQISLLSNKILSSIDFPLNIDEIILDLLNVFAYVYYFDIKTDASNRNRISVCVPVSKSNINLWNRNNKLIVKLLNFVTEGDGDSWSIEFIPIVYKTIQQQSLFHENDYSNVSLLSGGLDSFCGVSTNKHNEGNSIYCGFKTNNLDASYINRVYLFAKEKCPNSKLVVFNQVASSKRFRHQRTRSLLFFSLACLLANNYNIPTINVYENGIMTLNPSFQTRGTTRTTHPKTISHFQNLLNDLGIEISILHPYLYLTKGEIINALDSSFRKKIKDTRSCSRPLIDRRFMKKGVKSCGACVPCLLRKISLAAYNMEKYDHDYYIPYKGDFSNPEYRSAYNYFHEFSLAIKQGRILSELDIRSKYYNEPDFLEKTNDLLFRFNNELEIFFEKYGR